jgi:hypothetical protein
MKQEIPHVSGLADHDSNEQSWLELGEGDTGASFPVVIYKSAAVQVHGSPNGAAVAIDGRIHKDASFVQLEDFEGMPAQGKLGKIMRMPLGVVEIKPRVIGGNAETKLNVTVLCKR